jgi:hypothetical protein
VQGRLAATQFLALDALALGIDLAALQVVGLVLAIGHVAARRPRSPLPLASSRAHAARWTARGSGT